MDKKIPIESETSSGVNARIKVSTWLSGLVEEVRKKSQGPMQKWIDTASMNNTNQKDVLSISSSSSNEPKSTINSLENDIKDISIDQNQKIDENIKSTASENVEDSSSNINDNKDDTRKIWTKEALLRKFNQSFDKTTKTFEVKKAKINEFYDRVKINKTRYNFLKLQQKMATPPPSPSSPSTSQMELFSSCDNVKQQQQQEQQTSEENDFTTIIPDQKPEDNEIEDNFEISENDNFLSSTFNYKSALHHNDNDDDIGENDDVNNGKGFCDSSSRKNSLNLRKEMIPKNLNISNIGRSFSEAVDDDDYDDDLYLLNERSQSYSHVINRNNKNNNNNNNDDDEDHINNVSSHSLPIFSTIPPSASSSSNSPLLDLKSLTTKDIKPLSVAKQSSSSASFFQAGNLKDKSTESTRKNILLRDSSIQSDSSHCSSVESLLESRRPDPEAILINLGFGPIESEDILSRIPKRFLKPSQVRGIDTEAFLRRQQLANHLHDHSVLGYRGLVGNPDIPPSIIVAKIMERFEQNERKRCFMDINMNRPQSAPPTPGPNSLN